jgi:hypothetical protein
MMEIIIKVNVNELLGKSKELDLARLLEIYQDLQAGKEVSVFNGMVKLAKVEE